jgi:hypothetical protein
MGGHHHTRMAQVEACPAPCISVKTATVAFCIQTCVTAIFDVQVHYWCCFCCARMRNGAQARVLWVRACCILHVCLLFSMTSHLLYSVLLFRTISKLNRLLEDRHLPPELCCKLRQYFRYKCLSSTNMDSMHELLNSMSPGLREEVSLRTCQV